MYSLDYAEGVMDTARLRALRTFPEVQTLLQSFLLDRNLLPPQSQLIKPDDELQSGLWDTIDRAQRQGNAWCAWRHDSDVYGITAQLDELGSRAYGRPVLLVLLHNMSGHVIGSSCWLENQPGSWSHCPA